MHKVLYGITAAATAILMQAAPALAYGPQTAIGTGPYTITCTPDTHEQGSTTTCEAVSGNANDAGQTAVLARTNGDFFDDTNVETCQLVTDGGGASCTFSPVTEPTDGTFFYGWWIEAFGGEDHSGSDSVIATEADEPPVSGAGTIGALIGPISGAGSMVSTIAAAASDASPYALAVFGALTTVAVGMALITRARKGIVAAFNPSTSRRNRNL